MSLKRLERRFDLLSYLKPFDPQESDQNLICHCPQCDKPGKLWVLRKQKKDKRSGRVYPVGSFVCYRCRDVDGVGTGLGIIELIQWIEDCNFYDALTRLADGATESDTIDLLEHIKMALAETDEEVEVDDPLPSIELPEGFTAFDEHNKLPKYVRSRGIGRKRALRYRLGYCRWGYYRRRLIVPVYMHERLVSFQARYMKRVPPAGVKKSVFPKGVKTGRMLYNFDVARTRKRIVVVEDPFSAMHVGRSAVATFGTSLSSEQLGLLVQSAAEELVILWDRDAIKKAYGLVAALSEFYSVKVVELPDARDPDEHSVQSLRDLINDTPEITDLDAFAESVRLRLMDV